MSVSFSVKVQASDTGIIISDFVVCIYRYLCFCKEEIYQGTAFMHNSITVVVVVILVGVILRIIIP